VLMIYKSLNQIRPSTEEESHTPATRTPALKIVVTSVKEYESEARKYVESGILPTGNHARLVKSGWLANLVQRSRVAEAKIVQRNGNRSDAVVRMVQKEWVSYNDPVAPWRLWFPGDKSRTLKPTCYIHVSPTSIEVHDRNDKPYPNLPLLGFNQLVFSVFFFFPFESYQTNACHRGLACCLSYNTVTIIGIS
jgi:hypothetical protein